MTDLPLDIDAAEFERRLRSFGEDPETQITVTLHGRALYPGTGDLIPAMRPTMRLCFIDLMPWDYDADTSYERPLGGMQSAACHLAAALAAGQVEGTRWRLPPTPPGRRSGAGSNACRSTIRMLWPGFAKRAGMLLSP